MPKGKRGAFTLIELLVVIAILAILAALLLPALRTALDAARSAACLSNQRQLILATSLYAGDHDSFYPVGWMWQGISGGDQMPPVRMRDYIAIQEHSRAWVWVCPSDDAPEGFSTGAAVNGTGWYTFLSYGMSGGSGWSSHYTGGYGVYDWSGSYAAYDLAPSRREEEVLRTSATAVWSEPLISKYLISGEQWMSNRHNDRNNVAFADGHAALGPDLEVGPYGRLTLPMTLYEVTSSIR